MKLWGGRFAKPTAASMEALGSSIDFDRRLGAEDVRVNRAYARELRAHGIDYCPMETSTPLEFALLAYFSARRRALV